MKVNGDLVIVEGGVIKNLTLPSDSVFPANGNRGELFSVHGHTDATNYPDGLYHHDGTAWRNIAPLAKVKALIEAAGLGASVVTQWRTLYKVATGISSQAAGTFWFVPDIGPIAVASAFSTTVMSSFWYDPADYPAGTKFRLNLIYNQNSVASNPIDFTLGLRKVLRPAGSGGTTTQLIYAADTADVSSIVVNGPIPIKTQAHLLSAEFTMPTEAGQYCFVITLSGANVTSATHYDLSLQAKY